MRHWLFAPRSSRLAIRPRGRLCSATWFTVHRKPVIGIVGGIGSGKSLVAEEFERQGCLLISADTLNNEILTQPDVVQTLASWWGEGVLEAPGRLDRRKIAEIVFADPAQRTRLESLTHPLIRARRAAIIQAGVDEPAVVAIVLDSPLLFESRLDTQCDRIVFVEAERLDRLERLRRTRGWDDAELDRRERCQINLEEKKSRSQFVIRNDASPDQLRPRVTEVLRQIQSEVLPSR
ncbi:MAG: dephospho-CoA kinase [Planctomycetes bacterium]|nr:dephospho-CoA kinase [Planctomycetota bacterium]